MTKIITIGLDLAKSIFQVHCIDAAGNVVVAKAIRRAGLLGFFSGLEPCLVGVEACGSAHHWAREIGKLGHTVKLMPPKYVKAYVKRGKTDAGDAEAICEAVTRKTMTFVPVKSAEQQALAMLHSVRETLIGQRTQAINALRGHLSELGVISPKGIVGLGELAAIVRDGNDCRLPAMARGTLRVLLAQIETVSSRIAEADAALRAEHKSNPASRALETAPAIGPVIASALRARIADARQFENGRHMAAWIGLVPEQDSSGGRTKQRGISKKGDRYLRRLLVSGAMALIQHAQRKPDKYPWIIALLKRMHPKSAAVAVANKTARIAWAIMARGGKYDPGYRSAQMATPALSAPV